MNVCVAIQVLSNRYNGDLKSHFLHVTDGTSLKMLVINVHFHCIMFIMCIISLHLINTLKEAAQKNASE